MSLVGGRHAGGRVSTTLLRAAGLTDWLVRTPELFVTTVQSQSADVVGLERLRGILRAQVARSVLCDAAGFVRRLEDAMQQIWVECVYDDHLDARAKSLLNGIF